jgi:hypothetical protein
MHVKIDVLIQSSYLYLPTNNTAIYQAEGETVFQYGCLVYLRSI